MSCQWNLCLDQNSEFVSYKKDQVDCFSDAKTFYSFKNDQIELHDIFVLKSIDSSLSTDL